MSEARAPGARTEDVVCFRCGIPGARLYGRGPFGVVRCPRCAQVFISPRLQEDAAREIYDDTAYYEGSGGVYGTGLAARLQRAWARGRLDLIERHAGGARGKRLFEIGCAYGLFLGAARRRGFEIEGMEYSRAAAARARETLAVPIHVGSIEDLAIEDALFDVVCFWDVVEHVRNPATFLARVRAIVKPGGVVALSCPYFNSVPATVFRSRWWTLRPDEHLWQYTPRTLRAVFGEAGLPIERIVLSPLAAPNLARPDSLVAVARRPA